ncbi:MAG: HAMP domain-containing sensor histidine kinase, partial [Micromonosporaceae bacterium]
LVLVGLTTWAVVGWALTPVAVMRREVDSISGSQLHRRVAQPASGDEISRLARTMNRMLDRLEGAQASQRRFVSDVSHELRSPVASIRQHAEVALAHPRRTTVGGLAAPVHAETLRVQHLVEDLLLLARADESGLTLGRTPVDLDDLVFQQAERLRASTGLRVDTSGVSAGQVTGDPLALGRMLRNLADNAARHARRTVRFGLGTVAGAAGSGKRQTVVLTVEDDGPGVPESERERVLERFVRLDDARARDSGGSGLGLAIVSELVNAHDGAIDIGVGDLGGARIRITFPSAS